MGFYYTFVYFATAAFNIVLGVTIWLRNPRNKINQSFVAFIVGVVAWIVSLYFLYTSVASGPFLLPLGRFNYFAAVLLIYFLFLLSYYFPKITHRLRSVVYYFLLFETVVLALVTQFTPLIDEAEQIVDGSLVTTYGPLFYWFVVHFVGLLIGSLVVLFVKYKKLLGVEKDQLRLLFLGILVTMVFAVVTNLFVPLMTGYYDVQVMGPAGTVFLVSAIAYAIAKHRFLDITLLVARTVSYVLLLVILVGIYTFFIFAASGLLPPEVNQTYVSVFLAILVAFSFSPLRAFLEKLTDKVFFKGRYDTEELLSRLTHIMASEIRIQSLAESLLRTMISQMRLTKGAFLLVDEGEIRRVESVNYKDDKKLIRKELAELLVEKGKASFVFEELEDEKLKSIFRELDISVALALKVKTKMIGLIVLGPKASGESYSVQDLDVLEIFAPQAAVALQNADSYREIQEFSRTLERKVEERTKELKETQARELAKAKELLKLKDEFVFIASHDLGAPVTAIRGFVDLIQRSKHKFSGDIEENFEAIAESSNRLGQLVGDLLQVARGESGTIKVEVAPVDIVGLVEASVKQASPSAREKKVSLITKLDQKRKMVMADAEKLAEVLENLLSNAIKFNREGGKVEVSSRVEKSMLEVSVADTGYGIAEKEQRKVFQKFFKARGEKTKTVPGTGLGVFVVRMLVEKMGGKISFTSQEGKGTTFVFTLPLGKAKSTDSKKK